ncbi:MAG TPA: extracellular solute-binding protein [Bacillota bacterium]|nr:extracellular solute-binding protein [Bacillota bacterium]
MRKRRLFTRICLGLLAGLLVCAGGIFAKEEPVTIKVLQYAPEMTEAMHDMAREYHKQFPDVNLEFTILQTDYFPVLKARLNSGDLPDVFMTGAYNDNVTYQDYCYDLTKTPLIKNVETSALTGVKLNGKVLGFPLIMQSYSFIYNKKLFKDAGVTKLPRTLSEYKAVCEKLKSKGITPFGTGYREWWVLEQTMTNLFGQVRGNYTTLFKNLNSGKQKFSQLKEAQSIFDWIDLTIKYGENKPLETDFNAQCALIANGKVAMIHQGSWAEGTIRGINPNADIGFLLVSADQNPDRAGLMVDSNITYRVCKQSKKLKAVLHWLNWLATSDYGKRFVPEKTNQISTLKGAPFPKAQLAEDTANYIKQKVKTYPWLKGYWPDGCEMQLPTVLQAYVAGSKNQQQAAKEWDQIWMKCVRASQ